MSKEPEGNAEEKIKEAAKKLFMQKGFAATKTRDIAREANINLALLNYYYRSKEKLFDIIMLEYLTALMQAVSGILGDSSTSIEIKLEQIVEKYIDMFLEQPNLPMFIVGEIQRDPKRLIDKMQSLINLEESVFMKQMKEAFVTGKFTHVNPLHLFANLIGLTVLPFIGKPLLKTISRTEDEQYTAFVLERKKLIPLWITACFKN